jgi:hypothetical protein
MAGDGSFATWRIAREWGIEWTDVLLMYERAKIRCGQPAVVPLWQIDEAERRVASQLVHGYLLLVREIGQACVDEYRRRDGA